jgi:VanZ family protein
LADADSDLLILGHIGDVAQRLWQTRLHWYQIAMITNIFRALTWILMATALLFSVVPASLRPVTGAPRAFEHFAIFALCGLAFALGYRAALLRQACSLVLFCGLGELLQLFMPGRHARLTDFAVNAVASCVGLLAAHLLLKLTIKLDAATRRTPAPDMGTSLNLQRSDGHGRGRSSD